VAHALATSSAGSQYQVSKKSGGERAELTSTVVVGVEQREEGADGEDVVVLGELRHGGGRHCRLQVLSCVERRWSAWSCAGMQKR
jgi:hypothetical protein